MSVDTGLQSIGRVEWGTHFCHFYRDRTDLADLLVPYFKAGLEANEACLWVTAESFPKEAALAQLRTYFDDLDTRIGNKQLTLFDHGEWYAHVGRAAGAEVVNLWLDAKTAALNRGYAGLRLSGNMAFVLAEAWNDFNDYEAAVGRAFGDQPMLALCSYEFDRWDAGAILDVVKQHDFALAPRRNQWEVIESTSVKRSKAALAQQQLLTAELNHRVKNSIASVQSLVDQTLRRASSPAEARQTVAGRLTALARAHEQLAAGEWTSASLRDVVRGVAAVFGTKVKIDISDETLTARAALDLSLVFHELMTNAVKYGALRNDNGYVSIRSSHASPTEPYTIVWTEHGGPTVHAPTRAGFGTLLAEQLIKHDLRGECEFAFEPNGLRCTMRMPVEQLIVRNATCVHGCKH